MCKPWKRHRKGNPYPVIIELRREREAKRLRRDVMAEMLGYHWMTVGRWERGESLPSFQALHDWCQVLDVNLTTAGRC
jgi:transcriptional regulator with XRE-family HTH domain